MIDKVRPNVLYLATLAGVITVIFGVMLIQRIQGNISTEILALLVGIGIGSLLTLAGQCATDPPPPTVPASTHEKVIEKLDV